MKNLILLLASLAITGAVAQPTTNKVRIQLVHNEARKMVEVIIDGKPFTAYIYPGPAVLKKPVLYPIRTAGGNFITRGWPMDPRPGERVDHPHHVGLWFNYGDVNGHDFWNNSNDVSPGKPGSGPMPRGPAPRYGTIVHTGIKSMKNGNDQAELTVTADWLDTDNKPMLRETTTFVFSGKGNERNIDRTTTLSALAQPVEFKDNKEGLIGLRVARSLEHPSNKPEVFTDASGVATKVAALDNSGVTGQYVSSEGIKGDSVWGTRAKWVNLLGTVNGESVTITMFDHPKNVGYPTYWHARGYGLFAANPLAPSIFSNGKAAPMNYTLPANQSVTFRYRVSITSGTVTANQTARQAQQFDGGK